MITLCLQKQRWIVKTIGGRSFYALFIALLSYNLRCGSFTLPSSVVLVLARCVHVVPVLGQSWVPGWCAPLVYRSGFVRLRGCKHTRCLTGNNLGHQGSSRALPSFTWWFQLAGITPPSGGTFSLLRAASVFIVAFALFGHRFHTRAATCLLLLL